MCLGFCFLLGKTKVVGFNLKINFWFKILWLNIFKNFGSLNDRNNRIVYDFKVFFGVLVYLIFMIIL